MNKEYLHEILEKVFELEHNYNLGNFNEFKNKEAEPIKEEEVQSTFSEPQLSRNSECINYNDSKQVAQYNFELLIKKAFENRHQKGFFYEFDMAPTPCSTYIEMIPDVLRLDEDSKMISHIGFNFLSVKDTFENELDQNVKTDLEDIKETFIFERDSYLIVTVFEELKNKYRLSYATSIKILSFYFNLRESLIIKSIMNPNLKQNKNENTSSFSKITSEGTKKSRKYVLGSIYKRDFYFDERIEKVIKKYEDFDNISEDNDSLLVLTKTKQKVKL